MFLYEVEGGFFNLKMIDFLKKITSSNFNVWIVFLVLVTIGIGIPTSNLLSTIDINHEPAVDDCNVDSKGDVVGGCEIRDPSLREAYDRFWERGDSFKLAVLHIEKDGEEKAPHSYFLYGNNLISEDEKDKTHSELDMYQGDYKWSSNIRKSLKKGSTCSIDASIGSFGQVDFKYMKNGESFVQRYSDDPDGDQIDIDRLMNDVEVKAEEVGFENEYVYCKFKVESILDNNQHNGEFVSWDVGYPTFEGGSNGGSLSNVQVDFGFKPVIKSLETSEKVETGEELVASVSYFDPSKSTSVTWSNRETGNQSSFVFDTSGTKNISVTVSNKDSSVQESKTIQVVQSESEGDQEDGKDTKSGEKGLIQSLINLLVFWK